MSSSFSDEQPLLKINMDADWATIRTLYTGKIFTLYQVRVRSRFYVRKQLSVEFKDAELYKNLLRKEFEIGQQLDHPNIVRYVFITDDETGLFVFMDYLKGDTLQSLLAKEDKVLNEPTVFIRTLVANLSSAFIYLHDKGIFHGDVSPSNIVYNKELNRFFLIDLGFAATDNYIKLGGGTESFAAPEAFADPSRINATSDIYSFGKVVAQLIDKKGIGIYRPVIDKCCADQQSKRYEDFTEVAHAFGKAGKTNLWILAMGSIIFIVSGTLLFYHLNISTIITKAETNSPHSKIDSKLQSEGGAPISVFGKSQKSTKQRLNASGIIETKEEMAMPDETDKRFEVVPIMHVLNNIDSINTNKSTMKNVSIATLPKQDEGTKKASILPATKQTNVKHDDGWAYKIAEDKSYVTVYRLLANDTMKAKTLNTLMNKCMDEAFNNYKKFVNENGFNEEEKKLLMNAYYSRQRSDFLLLEGEIHKKYSEEAFQKNKK